MNIALLMFGLLCESIMLYKEISFLASGLHGIDFAIAALTGSAFSVGSILIFLKVKAGYDSTKKLNMPALMMFLSLWLVSLVSSSYSFTVVSERERIEFSTLKGDINSIETGIEAKKAELESCGANVYKKCITPRENELKVLTDKLAILKQNEARFTDYLASDKKEDDLAAATNVSKSSLVIGWATFRGLILNLLPFFFFYFIVDKQVIAQQKRFTYIGDAVPSGASPVTEGICLNCGESFTTTTATRKFCSPRCGRAYRERTCNQSA